MTNSSQVSAASTQPAIDVSRRLSGRLVRVHADGYGFIKPDGSNVEYFININDFPDRAKFEVGQPVHFMPGIPKYKHKAPRALNVVLAV